MDPTTREFWELMRQLRERYPDIYRQVAVLIIALWGYENALMIEIMREYLWSFVVEKAEWSGEAIDLIRKILRLKPPYATPPTMPPLEPPPPATPTSSGASAVAGTSAAELAAGSAAALGMTIWNVALPLLLVASKLGKVEFSPGFDKCSELYKDIHTHWTTHRANRAGFPANATRRSVMGQLEGARELVISARAFLRECPKHPGAPVTELMVLPDATAWRDEYLDWLANN
jgi:hypothetical protein